MRQAGQVCVISDAEFEISDWSLYATSYSPPPASHRPHESVGTQHRPHESVGTQYRPYKGVGTQYRPHESVSTEQHGHGSVNAETRQLLDQELVVADSVSLAVCGNQAEAHAKIGRSKSAKPVPGAYGRAASGLYLPAAGTESRPRSKDIRPHGR